MKKNKFYYYDEKNDLIEYTKGNESTFAVWVNPYLTLLFPIDCTELIPNNIVGFQINEMKHILHKAEEQASVPLNPEQERHMTELFTESGWTNSVNENGDTIWTKDLDWNKNGNIAEASTSTKQIMDANKGDTIN